MDDLMNVDQMIYAVRATTSHRSVVRKLEHSSTAKQASAPPGTRIPSSFPLCDSLLRSCNSCSHLAYSTARSMTLVLNLRARASSLIPRGSFEI